MSRHGKAISWPWTCVTPIDYQAMAMSYGLDSRLVTRADDIAPVIEAAMASGRPNLVEIVISTIV
ncbi:thiamine pyrophosphate-dependent enzyme [Komagataeibacter rhaeticus]|nr:thiamine pyrophosphate-dependent enzyme [Komagataeibacter rhaeticus]